MKRLWTIILLLAPLAVFAQQVVVSGNVVDDKTGDALGQVSVSAGRVSVVTNEDGDFTLKLTEAPGKIAVSHVGYKTRYLDVKPGQSENLKVRLRPASMVPEMLKGFYRETAMKRKHYIYVAEGVEDMYKTPYNRSVHRDKVAIVKGRRLLSQKSSDTLGIKVMGGPVQAVFLDLVKNRELLFRSGAGRVPGSGEEP